ncbi:hypothetical protein J6590_095873 [Homalodisca vitripennis]|nr:hypothetical protein J6590_095873 [Homalodisca vitripennis]
MLTLKEPWCDSEVPDPTPTKVLNCESSKLGGISVRWFLKYGAVCPNSPWPYLPGRLPPTWSPKYYLLCYLCAVTT